MDTSASLNLNGGLAHKRKKVKTDWICVNSKCVKSKAENVITAKPFVIAYFGAKIDEKRKRKVCQDCFVEAKISLNRITQKIQTGEPFIDEPLPIIKDTAVILDDSDEDEGAKTDSSIESQMEFELNENQTVEDLIADTINKLGIPNQIDGAIKSISSRLDALNSDATDIDANFLALEKQVDQLRASLYAPFKPELSHKGEIIINDVQGGGEIFDPTLPPLPPVGQLKRTLLIQGEKVIAMKGKDILGVWDEASIHEIQTGLAIDNTLPYKVKFENFVNGKLRSTFYKRLSLKHIAYHKPSPVRLQVGTRVIAVYIDPSNDVSKDFYSGIIAEPPKTMNKHRYLIFFDDGYASYIKHEDIRVVCAQTENAVFEDIHPDSRDFVREYLLQYPERPMVKLNTGQHVSVECEGAWWDAKVEDIDGSLVRVVFSVNGRREAIYRGSTRLLPLFKQMQQQKKNAESGNKNFARRNLVANKGKPYIEYTRNADEDFQPAQSGTTAGAESQVKRPTARKSTQTAAKKNDPKTSKPDPNGVRWESKGKVAAIDVQCGEGVKFEKHQCSTLCMDDPKYIYEAEKLISLSKDETLKSNNEKLKNFNPLLIPIILGWRRQLTKHKNMGKRSIYYVSPCGRRLRNLEEVHRFLRVTHSTLEIDFFNFEWYVHVFNYFTPERKFYKIDDISYGKENVPVSCVNSLDDNYPEYVEYSTVRLPQKKVDIPLDEGFLTCCDCDDGCQDKEKCSCRQMTIQTTAASNTEAKINPNAGYEFRRLKEGVPTGIYECNKFCKCSKTCLNRVAQNPLRLPLQVFKTDRRGWGIRTLGDVPRGGFICIYVGNLYTNEEANKQGQDFGDEYFAELDLIEVVEGRKEGYESDYEGDVEALSDDPGYKPGFTGSDDEDDMAYKDDPEDKLYKEKKSLGDLALRGSDASETRQTRQKKRARNDSESSNGDADSRLAKELEKQQSRPNSAENKPKFMSTRKYFHKGGDFYVMDAKSIGNIGRYLNHSCNPNVFVQNCFVDTHDLRFPWVAFFASTHITAGEELCWDYNYQVDQVAGKEIYCQCGADNCRGRLL